MTKLEFHRENCRELRNYIQEYGCSADACPLSFYDDGTVSLTRMSYVDDGDGCVDEMGEDIAECLFCPFCGEKLPYPEPI